MIVLKKQFGLFAIGILLTIIEYSIIKLEDFQAFDFNELITKFALMIIITAIGQIILLKSVISELES